MDVTLDVLRSMVGGKPEFLTFMDLITRNWLS
jgi:hypothetical protein